MIRRWLLSLLEADVIALVRDEVDLYLIDLGLDDRLVATAHGLMVGHEWARDLLNSPELEFP